MTERIGTILGRVRRKLKVFHQGENFEDPDLLDAGNEVQDKIFLEADIDRKFEIALEGDKETYDLADSETFEISTMIQSWNEATWEFVPSSEWDKYRDTDAYSYPHYFTIFGRELHVSPIPNAAWVSENSPIITVWGKQKKTIVPMDENTDPELPDIFDNAIVSGICVEFDLVYLGGYYESLNAAITTYNNGKQGIVNPDCEW